MYKTKVESPIGGIPLCLLTLTLQIAGKEVNQVLCDQFLQEWSSSLEQTTGKLRTFKLCKTDFRREKYLDLPPHLRSAVTKLCLSCHPLHIETGRYHKTHAVPV